jgi:hypothetical protein
VPTFIVNTFGCNGRNKNRFLPGTDWPPRSFNLLAPGYRKLQNGSCVIQLLSIRCPEGQHLPSCGSWAWKEDPPQRSFLERSVERELGGWSSSLAANVCYFGKWSISKCRVRQAVQACWTKRCKDLKIRDKGFAVLYTV